MAIAKWKQQWTKAGLSAFIAAAFMWAVPGLSVADHHEGVVEAAKEMVAEAVEATADDSPGKAAFMQYCASCHGPAAKGDGPIADTLKTKPADLTQISKKNGGEFNRGDVRKMIDGMEDVAGHGPREMPVWGVEFAEEVSKGNQGSAQGKRYANASIVQLVRYIESIQE